jgi:hypothetical protein
MKKSERLAIVALLTLILASPLVFDAGTALAR